MCWIILQYPAFNEFCHLRPSCFYDMRGLQMLLELKKKFTSGSWLSLSFSWPKFLMFFTGFMWIKSTISWRIFYIKVTTPCRISRVIDILQETPGLSWVSTINQCKFNIRKSWMESFKSTYLGLSQPVFFWHLQIVRSLVHKGARLASFVARPESMIKLMGGKYKN